MKTTILASVWLASTLFGLGASHAYERAAGAKGIPPTRLATSEPYRNRYRAIMFVHPQCSCSHASLHLFARLAEEHLRDCDFTLEMVVPRGLNSSFAHSDLWIEALRVPELKVVDDLGAYEAKKYGALTSGCLVLFDQQRRLVFSGGITSGRGVEGSSLATELVEQILAGKRAAGGKAPVYGCALEGAKGQ